MIYVMTGEPFQAQRAYRKLREKIVGPTPQGGQLELMEAPEVTATALSEACRSLSLFAENRLIVVLDADHLKKDVMEEIEPDLAEIAKGSEVIFLGEKLSKKTRFWQKVSDVGRWRDFRPLYDTASVVRWIQEECDSRGLSIEPKACEALAEACGTELGLADAALEKILLSSPGRRITEEQVEELLPSSTPKSLFQITDAVGGRQVETALRLSRRVLLSGETAVGIVALIARHFRILLKVKETGEGAPPYFLRNYQRQAGLFSKEALHGAIDRIFAADWEMKRIKIPPSLQLERLLIDLCGNPAGHS